MATWQPDLAPLVNRIPRLYFLLRAVGDAMHADLRITTGMRGVMASLAAAGPRTVPDLARERPVSRQHIQTLVNELLLEGLVETQSNPSHRRSPLVTLTDEGRRRFRLMRERETQMLARTAPAISHADMAAVTRLFDALERDLTGHLAALERA